MPEFELTALGRRIRGFGSAIAGAYCAATVSVILGVLRDASVVSYSSEPARFFGMTYLAGLCSLFAVNLIVLSATNPTNREVLIGATASVALVAAGWQFTDRPHWSDQLAIGVVVVCWVFGARAARSLISAGHDFIGRIREAVAAAAMAGLVALGTDSIFALLIGTVASTAIWVGLASNCRQHSCSDARSSTHIGRLIERVFLSNIGTVAMLVWALHFNAQVATAWGFECALVVRVSMYAFQAASVGWTIVSTSRIQVSDRAERIVVTLLIGCIVAAVASLAAGLHASSVVMPVASATAQYLAIILMIRRHRPSVNAEFGPQPR